MDKNVYITKLSSFLPNEPVENDEMEDSLGYIGGHSSRIKRIILGQNQIKQRYYAIKGGNYTHTNAELMANAIAGLFDDGFAAKDIQLLSCGTSTPDQMMPSHTSMVHGLLKDSNPIPILSPSGVCCSAAHALEYCFLSVLSGHTNNAICGGSELFSPLLRSNIFEEEYKAISQIQSNPYIAFEKDFLRWMLSDGAGCALLSDSKKHTIIDITDNGLYPLSAFVIEENFKKRLDATTSNLLEKYPSFVEPHIEIMRVFERYSSSNEALYDVVAVLFTRQGDRIVLRSGNASTASDAELRQNENATVFSQKALNIKTQKQNFYELRISSNSVTRLNPKIGNPLCIDLPKVNEANMYTYTNPRTGIQYIYDTENKIAFSHYTDDLDGDWILDDYGIRSWVESLPTKSISMATLANSYRIIGL